MFKEVEFSITHNRGCFGACNFCSIAFHQGRYVTSRSKKSIIAEAEKLTHMPGFKGYIHDVGGPTANFRKPSCTFQEKHGLCKGKKCLAPKPCKNLSVDHSEYLDILRQVRSLPKVKKVFIRSGIRYDYLLEDKDDTFFKELVEHHVSGQLKVAPEHCSASVLDKMGKPHIEAYIKFSRRYFEYTGEINKEQYLVPYLMSSHPGSTLDDAIELALFLKKNHIRPEQVQDFYPTPGTISTCMFYTELDPYTMESVYVAKSEHDKALQRALLQYFNPKNQRLVEEALRKAKRYDLIGYDNKCLIKPAKPSHSVNQNGRNQNRNFNKSKKYSMSSISSTDDNSTAFQKQNSVVDKTTVINETQSQQNVLTTNVEYPINLNSCSLEELTTIDGIGETRAQAILDYRDYLGGYTSVSQLKDIKGIGDATFAKIEPYVTV